jgi:hypothetical protein
MSVKSSLLKIGLIALTSMATAPLANPSCPADTAAVKDGAQTGFFIGGGGVRQVDHANTVLNNAGIPGVSKYYASFGFGHTTRVKRMITTTELMGTTSNRWSSNDQTSQLDAAYGLWNVGFDVIKIPEFNLYPLVGLGGGVLNLASQTNEESFNNFATTARAYPLNLWQGVFLLNAGLAADIIFPSRDQHAFTLGLRGGYMFDPKTRPVWRQDNVKITGGPAPDLSGPYIKLVLGSTGPLGWGHHHGKKECDSSGKGCTHAM